YELECGRGWEEKTDQTQLRWAPLGRAEAEEFLDALLGISVGAVRRDRSSQDTHLGAPLHALRQLILEKTDGTPFFMEEIVQELVEQGALIASGVGAGPEPPPSTR